MRRAQWPRGREGGLRHVSTVQQHSYASHACCPLQTTPVTTHRGMMTGPDTRARGVYGFMWCTWRVQAPPPAHESPLPYRPHSSPTPCDASCSVGRASSGVKSRVIYTVVCTRVKPSAFLSERLFPTCGDTPLKSPSVRLYLGHRGIQKQKPKPGEATAHTVTERMTKKSNPGVGLGSKSKRSGGKF